MRIFYNSAANECYAIAWLYWPSWIDFNENVWMAPGTFDYDGRSLLEAKLWIG